MDGGLACAPTLGPTVTSTGAGARRGGNRVRWWDGVTGALLRQAPPPCRATGTGPTWPPLPRGTNRDSGLRPWRPHGAGWLMARCGWSSLQRRGGGWGERAPPPPGVKASLPVPQSCPLSSDQSLAFRPLCCGQRSGAQVGRKGPARPLCRHGPGPRAGHGSLQRRCPEAPLVGAGWKGHRRLFVPALLETGSPWGSFSCHPSPQTGMGTGPSWLLTHQ